MGGHVLHNLLTSLYQRWGIRSLRAKLLFPIAGLMMMSLLGGTLTFVGGTEFTRNRLMEHQLSRDADRVSDALTRRSGDVATAATLLADDPQVIPAVQDDSEEALGTLNSRAVVIRDRMTLDLIQIYDSQGEPRTNLVLSTLYRESSMLDKAEGELPVVCVVDGHALLLSRATVTGGVGTVVTGIDLESELERIVSEYRLPSDLRLSIGDFYVSTSEDLPVDGPDGPSGDCYIRRLPLTLGGTSAELLLARTTTDVTRVMRTGLVVMVVSMLLATLLLMGLSVFIIRAIAQPIQRLSAAANCVAEGDLSQQIEMEDLVSPFGIGVDDEIGLQAEAFNTMVAELRSLYGDLEAKVEARTEELAATADVAQVVSSSLELDPVLRTLVNVIHDRLGFYHVGLFLIEPEGDVAILREAAGEASARLKAQGFEFEVGSKSILGQAAATQKPQVIQHVALEPVYLKIPEYPDVGSAAAIPLLAGQSVIGVLYAQHEQSESFTPDVINLLTTLADQIAVGMENIRLYEIEQHRRHLAEVLERTGRTLASSLDLREIPQRTLSLLDDLVPYERGLLLLREGDKLRVRAYHDFPDDERVENLEVPVTESGLFSQIVRSRSPLILDDVTQESSWNQQPWLPVHRSWLGVPILSKGEVTGMLSLTRREAGAFKPEDAAWVQPFAMQAGIALENAHLYAEITRFNEHLEQLVQERTAELDRAYHVLEQLDKSKSKFISVAAHELRTPLTVISGYTQVLQSFLSGEEEDVSTLIEAILSGTDRLHKIVNSMLDVAKIDSRTLEVSVADADLRKVIGQVCTGFQADVEARSLSLTVSGLGELPKIEADPKLLRKAFYHLVLNAVQYTPDGGEISITACLQEGDGEAPHVEIVVSDTGIGIAPEHQELIFETFYQTGQVNLHSSGHTKFKAGGPGLGLAVVRGIVLAHGGEIWVESEGHDEEGCPGSQFHVRLPVAQRRPSAVPSLLEAEVSVSS